jgi:hypothetical protein
LHLGCDISSGDYKLSLVSNILVCIDYITHAEIIRRSQIKSLLVSFVEPPLSPGTLLCSKAAPRTKQTHGGGGGSSIPPHYRELGERADASAGELPAVRAPRRRSFNFCKRERKPAARFIGQEDGVVCVSCWLKSIQRQLSGERERTRALSRILFHGRRNAALAETHPPPPRVQTSVRPTRHYHYCY